MPDTVNSLKQVVREIISSIDQDIHVNYSNLNFQKRVNRCIQGQAAGVILTTEAPVINLIKINNISFYVLFLFPFDASFTFTHNLYSQAPSLTIGRAVPKGSDNLNILGV